MALGGLVKVTLSISCAALGLYFTFLGILTIPVFQNQVIYLNRVVLTWFQDLNHPEQWGFMHRQITPFYLDTPDGEKIYAWHILPLELYRLNAESLVAQPSDDSFRQEDSLSFRLLRDDPDARLVLYFHGAAGTLGSGFRPPSYRAIYAGDPLKTHIVAIDYRGYGLSTGTPSEEGLLTDALTLVDWALNVAKVPPNRIVLFGQSLGTAVTLALMHRLAAKSEPTLFAGTVLVAPFADVEMLTASYCVAGIIPILSPLARFPTLLAFFNTFIISKWDSKYKIAEYVKRCEGLATASDGTYHITIIHAEDDYDIPWSHSERIYWHAVNASVPGGISFDALGLDKIATRRELGSGGWTAEHRSKKGILRQHVLKHGLHDRVMGYPVVTLAFQKAFEMQ